MPAKYTSFVSTLKEKGLAKQYYYCELYPPPILKLDADVITAIPFYMVAVNLPALELLTVPVKDNGLTRDVVVDKTYGTVTMTMFSDQNMTIKNFFDAWAAAAIVDNGGIFEYQDNYVSDMLHMAQLNSKKEYSYSLNLKRAYPKYVSDISMSSDSGGPLSFSVTWAYESWVASNVLSPFEPLSKQNTLNRGLQMVLAIQNKIKTVTTAVTPRLQSVLNNI